MKTGSRRGKGGSGNSGDTPLFVAPRLLACAWCAQQGRLVVAVRPLDDRRWCGHDWNYWRDMLPQYLSML